MAGTLSKSKTSMNKWVHNFIKWVCFIAKYVWICNKNFKYVSMIALASVKEPWRVWVKLISNKAQTNIAKHNYIHNSWDVFYTQIIRLLWINAWNLFETNGSALITWV